MRGQCVNTIAGYRISFYLGACVCHSCVYEIYTVCYMHMLYPCTDSSRIECDTQLFCGGGTCEWNQEPITR